MNSGELRSHEGLPSEIEHDISVAMRRSAAEYSSEIAKSLTDSTMHNTSSLSNLSEEALRDPSASKRRWGVRLGAAAVAFGILWGAPHVIAGITDEPRQNDPQKYCVPIEESDLYDNDTYTERSGADSLDNTLSGLQGPVCNDTGISLEVLNNIKNND